MDDDLERTAGVGASPPGGEYDDGVVGILEADVVSTARSKPLAAATREETTSEGCVSTAARSGVNVDKLEDDLILSAVEVMRADDFCFASAAGAVAGDAEADLDFTGAGVGAPPFAVGFVLPSCDVHTALLGSGMQTTVTMGRAGVYCRAGVIGDDATVCGRAAKANPANALSVGAKGGAKSPTAVATQAGDHRRAGVAFEHPEHDAVRPSEAFLWSIFTPATALADGSDIIFFKHVARPLEG